jgi:hypothetical protein
VKKVNDGDPPGDHFEEDPSPVFGGKVTHTGTLTGRFGAG